MARGARTRRAARIAAAMPIVAELTGYTGKIDNNWWSRRSDIHLGLGHDLDESRLWLSIPISRNGRGPQDADGVLAESNYRVIEADLTRVSAFGTDYRIDLWPGGSIHTLQVRADDALALRAVQQWVDALADYPVASDMDYSELEWEFNHPSDGECYAEDCSCGNGDSEG